MLGEQIEAYRQLALGAGAGSDVYVLKSTPAFLGLPEQQKMISMAEFLTFA